MLARTFPWVPWVGIEQRLLVPSLALPADSQASVGDATHQLRVLQQWQVTGWEVEQVPQFMWPGGSAPHQGTQAVGIRHVQHIIQQEVLWCSASAQKDML